MAQYDDLRQAAEDLLASASYNIQSPPYDMSHSCSINTISSVHPDHISEDLIAGHRFQGRMSNVRRFFCLFVTFDLLFTGLMWLICVMLNGENILKALTEQIYHYDIHTSLFDVVLTAFCRFVFLILFYAVFYINHWIIIAMSTTITCAFLISKVFVYDWPHSSQPAFEVLLVLTSFVLSWGEAWFLDFRVLPQESHSRRFLITNQDSERAPLIQTFQRPRSEMAEESVHNFYSPLSSPEGSVHRFPAISNTLTETEINNYRMQGHQALQEAWDLLQNKNWKYEKQDGDIIFESFDTSKNKPKIFKLTGTLLCTPKYLLQELYNRVEDLPIWHSEMLESRRLELIDEHTDITYQVSSVKIVSSRDFVNVRRWDKIQDYYIIACKDTEHPNVPVSKKFTRGYNYLGCFALKEAVVPNRTQMQWILHTDAKVPLMPSSVINTAVMNGMSDFFHRLNEHLKRVNPF